MSVAEAEGLMGFVFHKDSENTAGRIVYSNHVQDYLPFYLVVDRTTGLIVRRHNIRVLDEPSLGA